MNMDKGIIIAKNIWIKLLPKCTNKYTDEIK